MAVLNRKVAIIPSPQRNGLFRRAPFCWMFDNIQLAGNTMERITCGSRDRKQLKRENES